MISRKQIEENLSGFERIVLPAEDHRLAAVAIILAPVEGVVSYALTRRAPKLRRNAGNYALPGGAVDPEDEDAIAAAMRESEEELGVQLVRDQVVGLLDDFLTLTGHLVTPVIFWSDKELVLKPDPTEVAKAWQVPLGDLDHEGSPRDKDKQDGGPPIRQMHMQGSWINPPTAAWLYQFREVALKGRSTRVDQWRMPGWTAR